MTARQIRKLLSMTILSLVCLSADFASATSYIAPPTTAPANLANGDSLTNLNNSIFDPSTSSTSIFTINLQQNATVNNYGVLDYSGSFPTPSTIYSYRSNNATQTIINPGLINAPSRGYAIFIQNLAANTDVISLQNSGSIVGNVYIEGSDTVQVLLNGHSTVNGSIDLNNVTTSSMIVGQNSSNTYATVVKGINSFGSLTVSNTSRLDLNFESTIEAVQVDAGSTLVTAGIASVGIGAGTFNNAGTAFISGDITMTGAFTSPGTTYFTQALGIYNSSYSVTGTHIAQLYDVLNYGNVILGTVGVSDLNAFSVTYTGGYFPQRTYTLFTSQADIAQNPTFSILSPNSRYIAFSNLMKSVTNPNTITITLTRNPYQNYISAEPEHSIGQNLEYIGMVNQSADVVAMLDGVERSTTDAMLFTALEQFIPIMTPSIYALNVQNDGMEQAELRLAALRNETSYVAGDFQNTNYFWLRPFGGYGNQRKQQDTYGYYAGTAGIAFGMDKDITNYFTTGIGGAYSQSQVTDRRNNNTATSFKSYQFLWYGTFDLCPTIYLDFVASALENRYKSHRLLNINGYLLKANSNYDAQQYSVQSIVGKNISCGSCLITPEASAQYTFFHQYSYKETDANAANLNVAHPNSNILQFGIGGKFAKIYDCFEPVWIPELHANAYYNFINGIQDTTFTFLYGGNNMVANFNNSRLMFKVGAALTLLSYRDVEFKFNYDYLFQQHFTGYTAYLNFRYRL